MKIPRLAPRVAAWRKGLLGPCPFPSDSNTFTRAFSRPAARLCRRAIPAEAHLPASTPRPLRADLCLALRLWQGSQEITADFILRNRLCPDMDLAMTLNFAMALGNLSRYFLFCGKNLSSSQALAFHRAFAGEMTAMPALMPRGSGLRSSPAVSASRLARAFAAALRGNA